MNAITVELCAEDRARLDAIIAGLQAQAHAVDPSIYCKGGFISPADIHSAPAEALSFLDKKLNIPAQTDFPVVPDQVPWDLTTPADPAPAPAPAVKPVSLAEFQKAITLRCAESAETKAAVRGLVQEYATSVSAIPEEKRSEFLARLAAI